MLEPSCNEDTKPVLGRLSIAHAMCRCSTGVSSVGAVCYALLDGYFFGLLTSLVYEGILVISVIRLVMKHPITYMQCANIVNLVTVTENWLSSLRNRCIVSSETKIE